MIDDYVLIIYKKYLIVVVQYVTSAAEKAKMSWQKYVECDNSKIIGM